MINWTHNQLLHDLAENRRQAGKIVFCDQNIGPAGSPRPDILAITKSYRRWNPVVYEIKVSRSDFLSDVKSGKWLSYREVASAITFAVPAGLVKRTEVPEKCGLIVRHENIWRHAKKPVIESIDNFDQVTWLALLMNLHGWTQSCQIRPRASEFSTASRKRHELGKQIAEYLSDAAMARQQIKRAKIQAETTIKAANENAERIRSKAADENPRLIERMQQIFREHEIPYKTGWSFDANLQNLIDALSTRFDSDQCVVEARDHVAAAARALRINGKA